MMWSAEGVRASFGAGGGEEIEGFGSRIELTFLSLDAVAKYLSSPVHAHDQIILACWFFLSLRATSLNGAPVIRKKELDHVSYSVNNNKKYFYLNRIQHFSMAQSVLRSGKYNGICRSRSYKSHHLRFPSFSWKQTNNGHVTQREAAGHCDQKPFELQWVHAREASTPVSM